MEDKNERNLNITLKNQDEDKDEVVISLSTISRKLKKYFAIWIAAAIVSGVLAGAYAIITTHVNKVPLDALISFSYSGIEKGKDPYGRKFDVYTIASPSVIESAINELNIESTEAEYIRQGITIEGIRPKDAVDRITMYQSVLDTSGNINAAEKILETSYNPTQYHVYFDYNNTNLTDEEAVNVLNTILEKYQDYFYETYGYNETIGVSVKGIDYDTYDYSEAIDVFNDTLGTLRSYVKQLASEDTTRFRSSYTGYTFDDLSEAIQSIRTIDLEKISSYIVVKNITKDKEASLAYYDYRIQSLTRTKATYEERLVSLNESISQYQKDEVVVFNNGGVADSQDLRYSMASDQYDKMYQQKINVVESLAETKQKINYYKERQAILNASESTSGRSEKVEAELASAYEKINNIVDLVSETADDYYRNVTFKNAYNVLVPASNTASDRISNIIDNFKIPFVLIEALCVFAYFAVAFIEALSYDTKKRRLAKESAVKKENTAEVSENKE